MADTVTDRSQMLQNQIGKSPTVLGGTIQNQQNVAAVNQQSQIQQAVAAKTPVTAGQIQQTAGANATTAGQNANAVAKSAVAQTQQQGQVAAADIESQRKTDLAKSSIELDRTTNALADKLNEYQSGLKDELFDKQMSFQQDELGRTLWNDRQLMDYAVSTAKSDEELAQWQDDMNYASQVRVQMLQAAQQKILAAADNAFKSGEFDKDANLKTYLAQQAKAIQEKIAKEKARSANRGAMFSAVGTVAGAVIGSVVPGAGTVVGAAAGAAIGGAVGNIAASQTS